MVTFIPLNLVEDSYPSLTNGTNAMDLIICNNVFIYFSQNQIQKVTQQLVNSLVEEGWLNVSTVETPYIHNESLKRVIYNQVTIFQKSSVPMPSEAPKPVPQIKLTLAKIKKTSLYQEALHLYQQGQYKEVVARMESQLCEDKACDHQGCILLIKSYANLGQMDNACQLCKQCLQQDKLNPYYHFLNAELLQELRQIPQAIDSLKKALYLDSNFVLAYFTLGNLLLSQENVSEAQRCYRNALKILDQYNSHDLLPAGEEISAQRLSSMIKEIMEKEK